MSIDFIKLVLAAPLSGVYSTNLVDIRPIPSLCESLLACEPHPGLKAVAHATEAKAASGGGRPGLMTGCGFSWLCVLQKNIQSETFIGRPSQVLSKRSYSSSPSIAAFLEASCTIANTWDTAICTACTEVPSEVSVVAVQVCILSASCRN